MIGFLNSIRSWWHLAYREVSRSLEHAGFNVNLINNYHIALQFGGRLGSSAAEATAELQSDSDRELNTNLAPTIIFR